MAAKLPLRPLSAEDISKIVMWTGLSPTPVRGKRCIVGIFDTEEEAKAKIFEIRFEYPRKWIFPRIRHVMGRFVVSAMYIGEGGG